MFWKKKKSDDIKLGAVVLPPTGPEKYADIPSKFGILHIPSANNGKGLYYPTVKGEFIYHNYRNSTIDTISSGPAYGLKASTKEEAIKMIRDYIDWNRPKVLPRSEW